MSVLQQVSSDVVGKNMQKLAKIQAADETLRGNSILETNKCATTLTLASPQQ